MNLWSKLLGKSESEKLVESRPFEDFVWNRIRASTDKLDIGAARNAGYIEYSYKEEFYLEPIEEVPGKNKHYVLAINIGESSIGFIIRSDRSYWPRFPSWDDTEMSRILNDNWDQFITAVDNIAAKILQDYTTAMYEEQRADCCRKELLDRVKV